MEYLTCPTCGYFMGQKSIEFNTKKDIICSNDKLSEEEQGKEIQKLLKSLGFRRYCCQMRIFTHKDLSKEILDPNK
jgi:DNA-directed RNA polymerase subunit N (RpoN/RPB10)